MSTTDLITNVNINVHTVTAVAEQQAEDSMTVVEGLLAIPNAHDDSMIDLVTIEISSLGRKRKCCWGTVHIDFFGPYNGPWHKALSEGMALCLNVVEV